MAKKAKKSLSLASFCLYSGIIALFIAVIIRPLLVEAEIMAAEPPHLEIQASAGMSEAVLHAADDAVLSAAATGLLQPESPKPDKKINGVFTAYTSTPDQTDSTPFISATGERVYMGMVANNCLPFGTKLKLTFSDEQLQKKYGHLEYKIADRMNSRYDCNRFDIWLDASKQEARKFGVRRVAVEVYLAAKKKSTPKATPLTAELAQVK